jgi:large subunit ribosomal protein L25
MATIDLSARPRTVLGKKVKRLRREGIVPANIYGHNVTSTAIEAPHLELRRVIRSAGHTGLVRINLDGERAPRTTVIRSIQRKFTTGDVIHVDFQEVSLTEKMTVRVPVMLTGTAPVSDLGGLVVQVLDNVEVECLPGDIPSHFEADISGMIEMTSQVQARDLPLPENVTLLSDDTLLIASVTIETQEEEEEAELTPAEEVPTTAEAEEQESAT